ncbi:hypothetical protein Tdes44962_MAKER08971 [Teratosphaeria destructans]|uniref:Uncharacterized protein n=1 Tax=Teratosphaeria destructans TaxID=418781 RepID=A0A9W7W3P7_9PEZI|nr:hypothetical protein Tdes44962_MAKER08971 [Teratosphaeria destructans]
MQKRAQKHPLTPDTEPEADRLQDHHLDVKRARRNPPSSTAPRYSPAFWDSLSKVPLTRGALRELERRAAQEERAHHHRVGKEASSPQAAQEKTSREHGFLLRSDVNRIRRYASHGGPDLRSLRAFSHHHHHHHHHNSSSSGSSGSSSSSMSTKRSRSSRSRSSKSTTSTKNTSPYSAEFEQMLIDRGVYPDGYGATQDDEEEDEHEPANQPNNMDEIKEMLTRRRASLSPSRWTNTHFRAFKRASYNACNETGAMNSILPHIVGSESGHFSAMDVPFNNLQKVHDGLTTPKPDKYYGARPADIHSDVRRDLNRYIIPSTSTTLPAAPNAFFVGKGCGGRADVARRQAMYDGALGACAMHRLQTYGRATSHFDGNAYTVTSSYHPGTGTLQIYTTHPQRATNGTNPEYFTTRIGAYVLDNDAEDFRRGARAYRNTRDWAKRQRDQFIAHANEQAKSMGRERGEIVGGEVGANGEVSAGWEDSSADELAGGADVKRSRRA